MSDVVRLNFPAHTNMTVEQALHKAVAAGLSEVLIVGYHRDGELAVYSSHMTRKDAFWLAEGAKDWARNGA